ncbi:ABC transporter permease (plasmid) [Agrobacterium larrymoorei]|uniref:ABC transporter permease n=1 Tax=Agrobacterium larrymoorei TaxID=160699 RepID=A0ABX8TCV6_9HYPH|nr:ABC transporter permease [Agrobacterium larrymoorei]
MLRIWAWAFLAFLYAPVVLITLFSFHSTPSLTFPFTGFSLRWYHTIFSNADFMQSLWNSVRVATLSAVATTLLGAMAALALVRLNGPVKTAFAFLSFSPIALPGLFLGIALVALFAQFGISRSLTTVVIAHVLFTLPFFIEAMRSSVEYFDLTLEDAARDLGATPFQTFRLVTLPIIAPTIAGAAILCFALSFDEFIITVFASGSDTTLPLFVFSMMRRTIDPTINAASVLALAVSTLVLVIGGLLMWYRRRTAINSRANQTGE